MFLKLNMHRLKGPLLTNTLSMVRQCRGTSLHTSVTPQEQCTTQSFHFLHLQKAAGAYRDWKDDSKHALNNSHLDKYQMKKTRLKLNKYITYDYVWTTEKIKYDTTSVWLTKFLSSHTLFVELVKSLALFLFCTDRAFPWNLLFLSGTGAWPFLTKSLQIQGTVHLL